MRNKECIQNLVGELQEYMLFWKVAADESIILKSFRNYGANMRTALECLVTGLIDRLL
jgi:hypothetical protein